ncbi:Hypothetical protein ACGLYG10_0543 [Actinomyces glycerinitolerans]|uniref:Uncharacterized protein n=1 Tax=Actinomyces glycerinitolerans TaxID=1892869 RepID=A0A1M4RWK0_9ACTO|nr:Hypothetical protein ACGLYG10_0543 [Actinomyces glycerinitolerans]
MSLDARVITEPSEAWNAARSLSTISTTVSDASDDVAATRRTIASDCFSESTNAALSRLSIQSADLDDASTDAASLSKALDNFGYSMDSVKTRLAEVIADATAAGLTVSGSTIQEPEEDDSDADYATKKAAYDTLSSTLSLIRADESTAHDRSSRPVTPSRVRGSGSGISSSPPGMRAAYPRRQTLPTVLRLVLNGLRSERFPCSGPATRAGIRVRADSCRRRTAPRWGCCEPCGPRPRPVTGSTSPTPAGPPRGRYSSMPEKRLVSPRA